ncbi:MAG: DUF1700 domain-containing protein [Bacillota bacterium]
MNKITFIQQLSEGLKEIGINDIDEVIKDYESHFDNELLKGKTEEEIAHELGKISDILVEFQSERPLGKPKKAMSVYTVVLSDVFIYLGMLSLYLVNLTVLALSLGSLLTGIYFIFMMDVLDFIPIMVVPFSQFLGSMFIAFAIFSFCLFVMLFKFLNGLMKRLVVWHKEIFNVKLLHHVIKIKQSELVKIITLWSWSAFLALMIIAYAIAVNLTGNPQFWHEWQWFN